MGYYVSHLIGIRTGGVFSEDADMDDLKARIVKVIKRFKAEGQYIDIEEDHIDSYVSKELTAHKGSYVVLAGVFNYWTGEQANAFCEALAAELGTDILHTYWDEQTGERGVKHFPPGSHDDPITDVLRRVGG